MSPLTRLQEILEDAYPALTSRAHPIAPFGLLIPASIGFRLLREFEDFTSDQEDMPEAEMA